MNFLESIPFMGSRRGVAPLYELGYLGNYSHHSIKRTGSIKQLGLEFTGSAKHYFFCCKK